MARVDYADGTQRTVKNLLWLRNHARDAEIVRITQHQEDDGAEFVVFGKGWTYSTPFGSFQLACEVAQRPTLAHTQREIQYRTVDTRA